MTSRGDGPCQGLSVVPWPEDVPSPVVAERARGGWVATTWLVDLADGTRAVVKCTPYPADTEADGLAVLAGAGVPTPRVLGHTGTTLVMEYVTGSPDWEGLGHAVAGMHLQSHDRYGWHQHNRAGRFIQPNGWSQDWPSFFVDNRVRVHLIDRSIPAGLRRRVQRACDGPIQDMLPSRPPASLTHGDLWHGNVIDGRWVIDPEVCYADRELDLAYMQMTRTDPLPAEFWSAYTELLPFPDGYEQRRRVLELHHRLLHVRHFGQPGLAALDTLLTELGW